MLRKIIYQLIGERYHRLLLILGGGLCLVALYQMLLTAVFLHESVIVQGCVSDVRQQPFESTWQALNHGNWAWGGSTSYQPIVSFTLPGGMQFTRLMPDPDACDYTVGQQVSIITPPLDPSQAHVYKAQFIWGRDALLLITGLLMGSVGYTLMPKRKNPLTAAPRKQKKSAAGKRTASSKTSTRPGTPRSKRAPRKKKAE